MFDPIRRLIQQWRDQSAVEALSGRELDDLGLSRAQVAAIVRLPAEVPGTVARMARVFGLPEAKVQENRADYVEFLTACGSCKAKAECGHFLESAAPAREAAGFCPNAGHYAGLALPA